MPYSAGRMLASKIAYSARNSTGRIYPRSLVCVCAPIAEIREIFTYGIRNIGIRNSAQGIRLESGIEVLLTKNPQSSSWNPRRSCMTRALGDQRSTTRLVRRFNACECLPQIYAF